MLNTCPSRKPALKKICKIIKNFKPVALLTVAPPAKHMLKPLETALRTLAPPTDHMLMPRDNRVYSVQLTTISHMKIASMVICVSYMQANITKASPAHFKTSSIIYTDKNNTVFLPDFSGFFFARRFSEIYFPKFPLSYWIINKYTYINPLR